MRGLKSRGGTAAHLVVKYTAVAVGAALSVISVPTAAADRIILKSGEIVEGKIRYATDREVSIEVEFSPTIRDERIIPASEVETVERLKPDGTAFAAIRDTPFPQTALDPSPYDRILEGMIRPFLETYSYSEHVPEVEAIKAKLEAERARIADGTDVKFGGEWLDEAQFAAEKYQIEAGAVLEGVRADYASERWPEVLNAFANLKKSYPESAAYVAALPMALTAAERLEARVNFDLQNLPAVLEQRRQAVERTSVTDRPRIEAAFAREEERAAQAAKPGAGGAVFHATFPFDEKSLKSLLAAVQKLKGEIEATDRKALENGVRLATRARAELADGHLVAAGRTVEQLAATWPKYEGLARLKSRVDEAQEAKRKADEEQAEAIKRDQQRRDEQTE